jgi:hypothetical protein
VRYLVGEEDVLGSDFIVAEDKIGEDLSELGGDIWRDEGIHWCALCWRSNRCRTALALAATDWRGERFRWPTPGTDYERLKLKVSR